MFVAKLILTSCLIGLFNKDESWQVCEPTPTKQAQSKEPLFCLCKKTKILCSQETEIKDLCPETVNDLHYSLITLFV